MNITYMRISVTLTIRLLQGEIKFPSLVRYHLAAPVQIAKTIAELLF